MAAAREPFSVTPAAERSPWHSPVPYLFGGLAAMLGLIAFALLILACSYWKLSGQIESGDNERDLEAGEETEDDGGEKKGKKQYEEKVLVIMAGQVKPTFLATPISSSRTSSFGDGGSERTCRCGEKLDGGKQESSEEEEEEQSGNRGGLGNDEPPTSAAPTAVVAAADDTTPHQ